ncbi:MAG: YdeI/OmpD-associated family protein [Bacteroidota bacterium]|nr:YdeI/OmpD-associated family protein [Bacteroidota bacterium]MDQ6889157.1 YdeI/OmpD-associated family protein [Bacteroidota bacterium]
MTAGEIKSYYAKDRKAWRKWLQRNHVKEPGVWLIYYKKDSGKSRVAYDEAVEEALCFGWIDSIAKPVDEEKYKQKFTPRKTKSVWSALNKSRVEKLIEKKLMTPAGLEIIEIGKKNGSWTKLDHVENFVVPPDLKKFFIKNKPVSKYFESLGKSRQKQWLYRLHNARLPATRAKRLAEFLEEAGGEKKKK